MAARGALIVFEGCDRVGKSTQCKKLVDKLIRGGEAAKMMRFPGSLRLVKGLAHHSGVGTHFTCTFLFCSHRPYNRDREGDRLLPSTEG